MFYIAGDNMSERESTSIAWDFFSKVNDDGSKVKCSECLTVLSRGGKKDGKFNTSNMLQHLTSRHKLKYEAKKIERENAGKSSGTKVPKKRKIQPSLLSLVQQKEPWSNHPNSKKMDRLLAEMICLDVQPMSCVERRGFINVMAFACPQYKMKSRNFFAETEIPALYDDEKKRVSTTFNSLSNAGKRFIALTTDIWTEKHNN